MFGGLTMPFRSKLIVALSISLCVLVGMIYVVMREPAAVAPVASRDAREPNAPEKEAP